MTESERIALLEQVIRLEGELRNCLSVALALRAKLDRRDLSHRPDHVVLPPLVSVKGGARA